MELNVQDWKEFKVSDLFEVKYGINMELNTCDETTADDPEGIAFVARTVENNGVSAYIKKVNGKEPQPAETITVASGGSVLSTFVQKRPFYSGRDLYLLLPKTEINLSVKMFISTVLYSNQYRYSYGRQANKTLPSLILKLPIQLDDKGKPILDAEKKYSEKGYIPNWKFMEDYIKSLYSKPITTKIKDDSLLQINVTEWEEFRVGSLFELSNGKNKSAIDLEDGEGINYIGAKRNDNGVMNRVKMLPENVSDGNCVIFICNGEGSVGYSIYMDKAFIGTADIVTGYNDNLNPHIGLFIATVASLERPRYSFGRKWKKTLADTTIKLPIKRDDAGNPILDAEKKYSDKGYTPDWQFMEDYIKSLPYSDRI